MEALRIIESLAGKRLDPKAIAALLAVYERGEIRLQQQMTLTIPLQQDLLVAAAAEPGDPLAVKTTRS